jgi:hypothetical protein
LWITGIVDQPTKSIYAKAAGIDLEDVPLERRISRVVALPPTAASLIDQLADPEDIDVGQVPYPMRRRITPDPVDDCFFAGWLTRIHQEGRRYAALPRRPAANASPPA